ncbi:MAG: phosphodiester glycosidase family protein [Oscillospiraceae bacterium]|nr:phosphodiester glycosidase family protein [Oscillospiraceae bacterium]
MKRFFTYLLVISLLLTGAGASFVPQRGFSAQLAENAALTETVSREGDLLRRERYLTVAQGDARPAVVYGTTLYGKTAMDAIEAYPAAWGFSVTAGVNGSFFDVATGVPLGMVVTDGCVRSSGEREAVGFRADGSAIIGYPSLALAASLPNGETLSVHCNKLLTKSNGVCLYTRDFDSRTEGAIAAYNVVLMPDEPDLKLNSRITATVTDIVPQTAACPIPAGGFVLAAAEDSDYAVTMEKTIRALAVGDEVTIDITIGDGWGEVVSACAGMEMLVIGGEAQTSFSLSGSKSRTARTAVGLRDDGTLILYTVDAGGGMTLAELAARMRELGCVTALNLDGGGSTAIRALYPGKTEPETVNSPSDGKLRKCANFIFLLRGQGDAGEAARLFAYPLGAVALVGGEVTLTVLATDGAFRAAAPPQDVTFSAEGGVVQNGVFTAQRVGEAKIEMTAGGASGTASVQVIDTPDSVTIRREGSGDVPSGESVDFSAQATFAGAKVYASDECFAWTCESAIGTVDQSGLFTAAKVYKPATGTLSCAAGDKSASVKITVLPDYPFPDTEAHWAREYVKAMYDAGVLLGSEVDGVPRFRPDDGMTRQEFFIALTRRLGTDTAAYRETELPFDDADAIAPWALDAVRASYALGYLGGSADGEKLFALPDRTISRQEAMVILSRTAVHSDADEALLDGFADADEIAPWARQGLAAMVASGAVEGADGRLLPTQPVTRAQAAKLLASLKNV